MQRIGKTGEVILTAGVAVFALSAVASDTAASIAVDMRVVPAGDAEPGGPAYDYRISTFEINNVQFAVFLNDTLGNLDNERGQYMYFDTATGDVYVNSSQNGIQGSGSGGLTTLMFSADATGQLAYRSAEGIYTVSPGFDAQPVGGISWYGAIKFCNWLTIQAGITADQRCYTEAPSDNLSGWHPVTISAAEWAARDLSSDERESLVSEYVGYRLPMDEGSLQTASFNEWYKAASFDSAAPDTVRTSPLGLAIQPDHWIYGFGRDTLDGQDANYLDNGDPFDNEATPIGFFNGTLYNLGGNGPIGSGIEFQSRTEQNPYGLFDVCGNVWEWMQDQASGDPGLRRYRGGGSNSPGFFVENAFATNDDAGATHPWVGLRVVQSDPHLPPLVEPDEPAEFSGPIGGPFVASPDPVVYTLTSRSPDPLDWEVTADVDWLNVLDSQGEPGTSGTLAPFAGVTLTITVDDEASPTQSGNYTATLTFQAGQATYPTRLIELTVSDELAIEPSTALLSSGPVGGPFFPNEQAYTLTNNTDEGLFFCVCATKEWVLVDGQVRICGSGSAVCGSVAPNLSNTVTVALKASGENGVNNLPAGEVHDAIVEFEDQVTGAKATRQVRVSVGLSPLTIDMVNVPAHVIQPDGPEHSYRIGVYEITNAQFAAFLNDALFNTANERGAYMAHVTDAGDDNEHGDVYIHTQETGELGTKGSGTLMFDASDGERITFSDGQYNVEPGTEDEPVVGVSWYGAIKFSNWLTIRQGMAPSQRAYTEGTTPQDWHPRSLTDAEWAIRDLDDAERLSLIADHAGYRLPMDDGTSGASLFNEWYKAAAWNYQAPTGTTINATADGAASCDDASMANDLWWRYTPTAGGTLTIEFAADPAEVHLVSVHAECPGSTCNELACGAAGPIVLTVEAQETYWIRVATKSSEGGPFALDLQGPPCSAERSSPADDCGNAPPVCPSGEGANVLYGFGGDELTGADANFRESGDPFDNGLTPIGWFDGINSVDAGATPTNDTENSFGLYDLCGNASEWMQDQAGDSTLRATRGGHWQNTEGSSLLTNTERESDLANSTRAVTGFRIVQTQPTTSITVTASCDPDWMGSCASAGPVGGAYRHDAAAFIWVIDHDSPAAFSANQYRVCADVTWISLDDEAVCVEGLLDPSDTAPPVQIALSFNDAADALRAPPEPPIAMSTVPAIDAEPGGRVYSYRIATSVTTNEEFARFLNDALANPANARGQYMYFDTAAGHVYLNSSQTGSQGTGADSRTTRLFNAVINTHITFDEIEGEYAVAEGFEDNPAAGVSWIGALKYCNWLTIDAGLGAAQRTYTEGSNPGDWHSASISTCNWWGTEETGSNQTPMTGARDLNQRERLALAEGYAGYRLPWDDEAGTASAFVPLVEFRVAQSALDHIANLTFTDVTTGKIIRHKIRLLLSEPMSVTPDNGFEATGLATGPFADNRKVYSLISTSEMDIRWQVTVDGSSPRWLDVNGDASPSGVLVTQVPVLVTIETNSTARTLLPGNYTATVQFKNVTTGYVVSREFTLDVDEPLDIACQVTPTDDCSNEAFEITSTWGVPPVPSSRVYTLSNLLSSELPYTVSHTPSWITLDEGTPVTGTLQPVDDPEGEDTVEVTATTNENLSELEIGIYEDESITFRNGTVGSEVPMALRLTIRDPLAIDPPDADPDPDFEWTGGFGGPFTPADGHTYTVTDLAPFPIDYVVTADVDWLDIDGEPSVSDTLLPGFAHEIRLTINDQASSFNGGVYSAQISFADLASEHTQTRTVSLVISGDLSVTPLDDYEVFGQTGGPFLPTTTTYTLANPAASTPLSWTVTTDPPTPWILVNGQASAGGSVAPGDTVDVFVSIGADAAANLAEGVHSTVLKFDDGIETTAPIVRTITLTAIQPAYDPDDRLISANDHQPGGPRYNYMMSASHITNAAFVEFLNNAHENLDTPRGQYMFFDTTTGDVYINSSQTGESGDDPGSRTILMFSPSVAGQIAYAGASPAYAVNASGVDYSRHPVAGVSWYGALKFCNWLTIDQGMPPAHKCYTEDVDSNVNGWHPVTLSKDIWSARDLSDAERLELVRGYRGYRLPMDDGYYNVNATSDHADDYNEWYKGGAWDGVAGRNHDYGFGRDLEDGLSGADANYEDSGDPFDNATTPVDYYDGTNHGGSFQTRTNDNAFGLLDMTGNVLEWMQGQLTDGIDSITLRTIRGASFSHPRSSQSLLLTYRVGFEPYKVHNQIGFRVVRTVATPNGDSDLNGTINLEDFADLIERLSGPGVPIGQGSTVFDLQTDGDIDLGDFAGIQNTFGASL